MSTRWFTSSAAVTPDAGIAALVVASFLRDDLPWLYEMGVELYRQSRSAEPPVVARAYRNFVEAAELVGMGPFPREMRTSRQTRMLLEELPMLLRRFGFAAERPPSGD